VRTLAARDYAGSLGAGVDLVVMFLPGDPFLAAAFARDPDLQIEALRERVLIATPTTLVALLRTVAIYWQQRAMAENAEAIAETARDLYERAAKFGHELSDVGSGLRRAIEAYNRAVGSFEGRLIPMARKLEETKVTEQARRELESPGLIDQVPRELRQ
jgi:DNA recombination protein RmuC